VSRLLLLDNYDSFTWNLAQAFMTQGAEVKVVRNDQTTVAGVLAWSPSHVCVSPRPGRPEDAGISIDLIRAVLGKLPLLGVCLGHQAMSHALGGTVTYAPRLMHGKSSDVFHDLKGLYRGLPNPLEVARYHSLIVDGDRAGEGLSVTSYTKEGEVMGVRHDSGLAFGVQFHPESVLTPLGDDLLANFLAVEA
jgi:anthranilate synthase/aminodeoxychorismate synthase-like glutamine amidotransferase